MAAQCSASLNASCPQQYSLSLFCAPGGGGGTVGNLGLFEARLGSGTCSTTTQDPMTGEPVTTTISVTTRAVRGVPEGDRRDLVLPGQLPAVGTGAAGEASSASPAC